VERPLVSIILPVYNAEKYIAESIHSLLQQTYSNIEIIVLNDGSKDNSEKVIAGLNDGRIKYYSHANIGMAATLNKGLKLASGDYIARQDADDVSLPDRIKKQIDFLEAQKEIGLAGTWAAIIDEKGRKTGGVHHHPVKDEELKFDLLFDNPFVHSSVMFRKKVVEECGTYNEQLHSLVQDFEYWFRISGKFKVANIAEELQLYRQNTEGISAATTDFSARVAEQCSTNLMQILKCNKRNADKIAFTYHACTTDQKNLLGNIEFNAVLNQLADALQINDPALREKLIARHLLIFKKNRYNYIIYNPQSGFFDKLLNKVKRKML
jgi:glycosyltransferase involved in cell wall biosynthesis